VKSSELKNVLLRDDWSYQKLLDKCVQEIYSEEEQENATFYMGDKGGVPIWTSDTFEVDVDGKIESHAWTLREYIILSGMKYPSKTKLYCVKRGQLCVDIHNCLNPVINVVADNESDAEDTESNMGMLKALAMLAFCW
jgi:hypothetical protein